MEERWRIDQNFRVLRLMPFAVAGLALISAFIRVQALQLIHIHR